MGKPKEKAPLAERFPVLTYSLSYNTAGTAGRKTRGILENAAEMRGRHKAGLFGNIRDALVGFLNQILRGLDAHTVDVLDQAEVDGLFEEAAEIVGLI